MRIFLLPLIAVMTTLAAPITSAQDLDHGRRLAERWCAECHAIGPEPTKFRRAPSFAALAHKENMTFGTLRDFLLLPHATMSNVALSRSDAGDLAGFIMSMQK